MIRLDINPVLPLNVIKIKVSKQNSFTSPLSDVVMNRRSNVDLINFYLQAIPQEEKKNSQKRQTVGDIERYLTGSSLKLFNLLYCKYLIPLRCLLAISGHINRRGARQKGQNQYLRLSDMPPPASNLHLDVAGITRTAIRANIVSMYSRKVYFCVILCTN